MVTLVGPLAFHEEINIKHVISSTCGCNKSKFSRHVLKHKHTSKPKCKKLYKYRLRRNGEEDPDVIDVSHILLSTLKIKSPRKLQHSPEKSDNIDKLRPKNYLFKMARRKQKAKAEALEVVVNNDDDGDVASIPPETENQQKQKTNAFKLLMDSRNKSIGANSPGKEKTIDPAEVQQIIEKKTLKVKRNLALQKMAEAKGSLKKKELDELEERCIQRKMEKRAERLKSMIKPKEKSNNKNSSKEIKKPSITVEKIIEIEDNSNSNEDKCKVVEPDKIKIKSLQLVDIFKDVIKPNNKSPKKKMIPKEDKEFLSKLSPSMRKKENMLCYFKKIDKNSPSDNAEEAINSSPVLKVKLSHKHKKKIRRKRLSLHKNLTSEVLKDHNENSSSNNDVQAQEDILDHIESQETSEISNERKKRKRKQNFEIPKPIQNGEIENPAVLKAEECGRPKRNIKRPVKYVDDVQLSSSDEEFNIFTPIKRKRREDFPDLAEDSSKDTVIIGDDSKKKVHTKSKKNLDKDEKVQKKATKLAPIFAPKPQLNPEQMEAKQRFLYSGVPEQIKKIVAQQKNIQTEGTNDFPIVVHVQQNEKTEVLTPPTVMSPFSPDNNSDDIIHEKIEGTFSNLLTLHQQDSHNIKCPLMQNNTTAVLQKIKEQYPKFPVYRTFRSLRTKSRGELTENNTLDFDNSSEVINEIVDAVSDNPQYLNWTDKYKATSTKHLVGNFESMKELKKWLQCWTELEMNAKSKKINESDSSDFYDSDSNSKDSFKNNLLIVSGPVGSGKTSSVYAVAAELAIKVIEVNASSKRTGKVMLQDLQEATQSHKVNRGGSDNSQKSQEIVETVATIVAKKRGRPKKTVSLLNKGNRKDELLTQSQQSQDNSRTVMSLILVDDADIVFDQDDGFSSAISQLIQCSKRPVILVAGSLTCTHLQRFLQYGKVIKMRPLSPKVLGTWLDIMCLADGQCWPGLGAKFLEYFRGDIRKSINYLQLCMTAYSQNSLKENDTALDFKASPDDENSNFSWPDSEGSELNSAVPSNNEAKDAVWRYFMKKEVNLMSLDYPKDLFNVWWNFPSLLKNAFDDNSQDPKSSQNVPTKNTVQELQTIANALDSLALSDYYSCSKPDTSRNLTSNPWHSAATDSVSELECFECYNRHYDTTNDILQELVAGSITQAQKLLQCDDNLSIDFPDMAAKREKDRLVSRHDTFSNILSSSALLDRRALALDYWSTYRSICRIEKNRTDMGPRRNNRFCHYLKSLNVMCRSESFDKVGDSLIFKGKD